MEAISSMTIKNAMAEILSIQVDEISDEKELTKLVRDSFLLVDLVIQLQEEFKIRLVQADLKDVSNVKDLVRLIQSKQLGK